MKSQPKDERFTPKQYIMSVKEVLGEIDIDLFSSEKANLRINAKDFFTKEDSAFEHLWVGNIFANPPYSRGHKQKFVDYLLDQMTYNHLRSGIFLLPNDTEAKYFQSLLNHNELICCLTNHRIKFISGWTNRLLENPENGSAFFYYGDNQELFASVFQKWGTIITKFQNFDF